QHKAQGVALLGANGFAVLAIGEDRIAQHLLHRDRAGHYGAIRPLGQHPGSLRLQSNLLGELRKKNRSEERRVGKECRLRGLPAKLEKTEYDEYTGRLGETQRSA